MKAIATTKIYTKDEYLQAQRFVKKFDPCFQGGMMDQKCISSNSLGMDSFQ
jgi:hypothetical protein